MTAKQSTLIDELYNSLPKDEEKSYKEIINYLITLGYIPQKQKVQGSDLSFKHKITGKVIAKVGLHNQRGRFKIKFFACTDVSDRFIKVLYDEAVANEDKYSRQVPPPDCESVRPGVIMKKCTLLCPVCSGGGMRYFYRFSDGREIFRCGAYPVEMPEIKENDIEDIKRLIFEQHNYFLSIA